MNTPVVVQVRREIVWFDEPEVVKAVTGRSVYQLMRWASEGLTVHVRTYPRKNSEPVTRKFVLTDELIAFLRATSRTNHEIEGEAGG